MNLGSLSKIGRDATKSKFTSCGHIPVLSVGDAISIFKHELVAVSMKLGDKTLA